MLAENPMSDTNISYALATIDNPNFDNVRDISEDDFNRYSKYISELTKLSADENLFKIVELNHIELKQSIEKYTKDFSNGTSAGEAAFAHMVLDVNRLILNFLSSIRTYLDHTETRLKRNSRNEFEEFKYFKQETSKAYDDNFFYRFLYKLRNYSQHCGLPAATITFHSQEDENEQPDNALTLFLNRDELLNNFNSWGIVEKELLNQPEKFDIIPLVDNKFKILNEINSKINSRIYLHFHKEGHELMDLIWASQEKIGIPCLIKTTDRGETATLSIVWFPFEAISKITGVQININPDKKPAGEQSIS